MREAAPAARRTRPEEAWRLWLAEFVGTALLVSVGLSAVIIDTSPSGPVAPLYALMVYLEAPVSGTSTNPARSLGPAVIAWIWPGWWVYWAGPVLGALIGVALIHPVRQLEVDIAKVYDFEHDRYGLLRWSGETDPTCSAAPATPGLARRPGPG